MRLLRGALSSLARESLLVVVLVWINAWAISNHWVIPSQTLDSVGDKYFSYRPWVWMRVSGHHACDDYH